jgi:hypothetical protein
MCVYHLQGASTLIIGDVGSYPGVMPPGEPVNTTLVGINHGSDAVSASAQADALTAHGNLSSLAATPITNALAGVTLLPGVYSSATFTLAAGVLTFDGLNVTNSTFVMVSPGYILVSALSSMVLVNGASASRVFWAIGDYASFAT